MQKSIIKLIVGIVVVSLININAKAQIVAPAAYSSSMPVNYVRTWDAKAPQANLNTILTGASTDSFLMTTQYLDGLGRPIQTVAKGFTPLGKDLVTPIVYDSFGREQYKYLPFAANNTGGNGSITDGLFKLNPFQEDSAFYQSNNAVSPIKGQSETYFYSKTVFETSPLNRVLNSYAAGNSWIGSSKGIGQQYLVNQVSDSIRIWNAGINASDVPTTSSTYNVGDLFKNVTTDENGKQVVEYKDKEGKVILKKVQLATSPGTAHVGWLCTYYVYDEIGNLRFVLQPQAIATLLLNGNWTITAAIRNELCFYYGYDARQRMTTKKVPGSGEAWMIYDSRDRLAYSQDSNMRAKNWWLTTAYDGLNRPVLTAMMTYTGTRAQLQSYADTANLTNAASLTIQGSYLSANISFAIRETGRTSYQASQSIEFRPGFESETNASFTAEIITASSSSSSFASAGNPFPAGATYKVLTQTFYDDYAMASKNYSNANNSKLTTSALFAETLPSTASLQTRGLTTSTKVWVMEDASLNTGKWLETTSFYDDKARAIQSISDNEADGKDTLTTRYDVSGKVVCTYISHRNPSSNIPGTQVRTNNNYDVAGRLTSVQKRINDNSATDKTIATMSYDEIGELKKKVFGSSLDSMEYDYNIRGWMLGANRDYAKSTSSTTHYFGFDLGYDKQTIQATGGSSIGTYTANQLNGNITGLVWKSTGDDEIRKYDFTYDAINRLTGADFNQYTSSSFNKTAKIDYSVTGLSYDANGNILFMNQKGWKVGGSVTIDSLAYGYNTTSNKLNYVTDRKNDTLTRLGDFKEKTNNTSQDYSYDGNGNMYIDNNKSIGNIHYNHLNLPDSITVTGKGTIQYVYDATGNKLKKITKEGSKVTTTLYLFGNYVNDTLQYLPHEEGRVRYNIDSSRFEYDYFVKDHLGNVRMVLTEANKKDQYPMASMEIADTAVQNALYYNLNATRWRIDSINGYPSDGTTNPNAYVAKTNGSGNKIGPAIILKVMAGDKLDVRATDWYNLGGNSPSTPNSPLSDLVNALTTSIGGVVGSKATTTELTNSSALNPGILSFYGTHNSADSTTKPKAFLNWIAFDEQMNFVSSSSGFLQVEGSNQASVTSLQQSGIAINKNGYFYVYVCNETPNINVFFDNLQVTHYRGPLLEETHYYPFGLTMQGISSKAVAFGNPQNKKNLFQNQELDDDLGINYYEFKYRNYDPQIGRFIQIDPLSDKYVYNSPYAFSENHVTSHVELEGLEKKSINDEEARKRRQRTVQSRREQFQKQQQAQAKQSEYFELLASNRAVVDDVSERPNGYVHGPVTGVKGDKSSHSNRGGSLLTVDGGGTGLSGDYGRPDGDPINVTGYTVSLAKPDPEDVADWAHLFFEIGKTSQEQKDGQKGETGADQEDPSSTKKTYKKNAVIYHREGKYKTKLENPETGSGHIVPDNTPANDTSGVKQN